MGYCAVALLWRFHNTYVNKMTRSRGSLLACRWLALWSVCALLIAAPHDARADESEQLTLWHAYRGAEEATLQTIVKQWNAANPKRAVRALAVPFDAYDSKVTNAIPRGHGPDVFIAAHERVGAWSQSKLLEPWGEAQAPWADFETSTIQALTYEGKRWGLPVATKSVVLFYNTALVKQAPQTTDELLAVARKYADAKAGKYGLLYETGSLYTHAPWLFGFGGQIFDAKGAFALNSPEVARSYAFARDLVVKERVVPEDSTSVLVARLFNEGKAPFAINGPWFLGELKKGLPYAIAPLPKVSQTGKYAQPFMTVEAAYVSAYSKRKDDARAFATYLVSKDVAILRALKARQPVATRAAYDDARVKKDMLLDALHRQSKQAVAMPNNPKMSSVWEPANQSLQQVLRGARTPELALKQAEVRFKMYTRPAPTPSPTGPYIALLCLLLFAGLVYTAYVWRRDDVWRRVRANWPAYLYMAPAVIGMMVLIVVPFVVGSAVSLFAHRKGEFTFVGLTNFFNIITSADYGLNDPLSFYFTLLVTVVWTAINVFFHVTIGLGLAMLLREEWLKLRGVYRVLLIIPWAIPNYITALIWKGMFHKQFGSINAILGVFGVEPVSWFSQFSTAFAANLTTNIWLGFPFMMVMTLGALQAIPRDLEEAAEVDGASRWQRFQHVIFPLLKPALIPAIILGTVWTFNAFNIIYLVSAGQPDGATEILISEAYKWAFSRQQQYGYAAAYSVLIFLVLLGYSALTGQLKSGE